MTNSVSDETHPRKEFSVSIDVITDANVDVKNVAKFLGVKSDDLSVNKRWKYPQWRFESPLDQSDTIDNHIDSLISGIFVEHGSERPKFIKTVFLNIGVFYFESITCTVEFNSKRISELSQIFDDFDVSICCYPSIEDE